MGGRLFAQLCSRSPRLFFDSQFAEKRLEDGSLVPRPCQVAGGRGTGQCRLGGGKDVREGFEEYLDELDGHVPIELNRLAALRLGLAVVRSKGAEVNQASSLTVFDDVVVAIDLGRVRLDPLRACGDGADTSHGRNCRGHPGPFEWGLSVALLCAHTKITVMSVKVELSAITRPAVLAAIEEFDELGQDEFLRRRGYAEARNFRLVYRGRFYDSKAIAGVAHGYATGYFCDSSEFSGGLATVSGCLTDLGFVVDHGGKHARGGLLWDLETTQVFKMGGRSAAYKFVVLRWAVERADEYPGLVPFSAVRKELAELLAPFSVAKSAPNPADPWVALRGSSWWALEVPDGIDATEAGHQALSALAVREDLRAGLSESVRFRLKETLWREEVTEVLDRRIAELSSPARAYELVKHLGS